MEPSSYQSVKMMLESITGLSRDAMHIYVGLGVFFVAAMIFRKPLSSFIPVAAVIAAAVAGELLDMRDDLRSLGHWRWQASLRDVANTSFWPFALWLLARVRLVRTAEDG